MRILDKDGNELDPSSIDYEKGHLVDDKILVAHHPAQEYVEEKYHYDTIKTYPNGGKDLQLVIDVPGQEAKDAWDEYEDIQRYVEYTQAELDKQNEDKMHAEQDVIIQSQTQSFARFMLASTAMTIADNDVLKFSAILPEWTADGAFKAKEVVKFGKDLYRAVQDVPASVTDEPDKLNTYWSKIQPSAADGIYEWLQPLGATDCYSLNDIVMHNGKKLKSTVNYNVWEPGVYGWTEVKSETETPDEWPEWVQPTGAHDAYASGAKVSHNGKHWTSNVNGNVWEPGAAGITQWTESEN